MAPLRLSILPVAAAALATAAAQSPVRVDVMVALADVGSSATQLLRVDLNNASAPYVPLGAELPGWVLVQGDASALDAAGGVLYAVLNAAGPSYSNTSLFAFDALRGGVLWSRPFPVNYTMGALATTAGGQLVGLCGALLTNGSVQGYCGVNTTARGAAGPHLIADWAWTLMYDPDTRALDTARGRYYHRLYNATWMPDYFTTLDAATGGIVQTAQFSSPEFSGTRVDSVRGIIYSICNAPGGLDLCTVDATNGGLNPLGVFDRMHESSELFAATAVLDAARQLFLLTVDFAEDGLHTRVVDLDPSSPTYANIVANISVPTTPWWPGNYHVLGETSAA
jgi:hypothetical protein